MSCILIGGCCWSFATIVFHEPSLSKQSKRISKQGSSSSRTAHCRTVYGKVLLALLSARPLRTTPSCYLLRNRAYFTHEHFLCDFRRCARLYYKTITPVPTYLLSWWDCASFPATICRGQLPLYQFGASHTPHRCGPTTSCKLTCEDNDVH